MTPRVLAGGGGGARSVGAFQQTEPLSSRAEQYKSPGDNSSPAGRTIAAGIGTASFDGQIVWWDGFKKNAKTGKVTASFVMNLADCIFTPTFALVRLFADEQLIISNDAAPRTSTQKIRYYNGSQTTPDPLLVSKLGAEGATAWPGMAYAVFEDFDCTDYGNRVPLIRAVLSGAVSVNSGDIAPEDEILSTITFEDWSTYDPFFGHPTHHAVTQIGMVDFVLNKAYAIITPLGVPAVPNTYGWVSVVDIRTMKEVARNPLKPLPGQGWRRPETMTILQGSGFFVTAEMDGSDPGPGNDNVHLWLVNAFTGEIVTKSSAFPYLGGVYGSPTEAVLIESGARTRYLVFTEMVVTAGATKSGLRIHLVDVTNGTITEILTPETAGIGANNSRLVSLALGPVENGEATIYFTSQDQDSFLFNGLLPVVYEATITAAGVKNARVIYTEGGSAMPQGVAYDFSDDTLVIFREDGSFRKVTLAGVSVYETAPNSNYVQFGLNVVFDVYGIFCKYVASPGIAYAIDENTYNTFRIDLSDGSVSLYVNADDSTYLSHYGQASVNEFAGFYIEPTSNNVPGQMAAVFTGGGNTITPDVVDLVDTFTRLATFDGRFSESDLIFSGFPGNEMYGLRLENDTTIDNLEQSIAEPFDVKIVESDGKRKYIYPPRDGSFIIDAVLTKEDFVEVGTTIIEKGMGSGEEELAACTIAYFDRGAGYKKLEQTYQRPVGVFDTTRSKKRRTINTTMTLTASQAKRMATEIVYRSVLGNVSYGGSLVPGCLRLEPGDIIQFPFGETTVVARITETAIKADYTQDFFADEYLRFADADIVGSEQDGPADDSAATFDTRFLYLDLPLLSPAHDLEGAGLVQYALIYGSGDDIVSGIGYKSPEGFQFTAFGDRSRVSPVVGVITAISGTPDDPFVKDETNTIEVQIQSGDIDRLETITEEQFEAGANLFAIGRNGRWVLLWAQTITPNSPPDGRVTLADLMWGVRGSEVWIDNLEVGDFFVRLDAAEYLRFRNDLSQLGDAVFYKAAHPAISLGSTTTHAHVASGVAETPYASVNIDAEVESGTDDIIITWDERSRVADGLNPTNHGEAERAFEVEIMDSGDVVLRTFEVTTNLARYELADYTSDFGSLPGSITVRVYKMSAVVGRGYAAEATITLS